MNLLVLLGAVAAMALDWNSIEPLSHLLHFGLALAGALVLFGFRFWGGGDAKFYAACALWFSLDQALPFIVATAASGILVVIVSGVTAKLQGKQAWRRDIPYGVAIAAGAIFTKISAI